MKASDVTEKLGSSYPAPYDEPCLNRSDRNLGDFFELQDFGVHLLTLPPGAWSSQRHWHSLEDEFIYVLSGEPTLVTDDGEDTMEPGEIAGFRAAIANGHHLVNNTNSLVSVLVIGSRKMDDDVFYADIDMQILKRGLDSNFSTKDGKSYSI